jgi:arginase
LEEDVVALGEREKVLLASRLAAGMEVTIFDPDLDPDGKIASAFADDLVAALADVRPLLRP